MHVVIDVVGYTTSMKTVALKNHGDVAGSGQDTTGISSIRNDPVGEGGSH